MNTPDMGQQLAANLFSQLTDANLAAAQHIAIGREQGQREAKAQRDALAHIVAMYDRYPDAMLPTPLLAAIEAGRKVL